MTFPIGNQLRLRHGHGRGQSGSPTYLSWKCMLRRCTTPTNNRYHYYGGRGITVCDRWQDFGAFLEDMGERPAGTWLDRIDPNGNYEPRNCRWATPAEQGTNKRPRRKRTASASGAREP